MTEPKFVNGMVAKKPNAEVPDFIIAKIGVKMKEFIDFAEKHHSNGWLNIEIKRSKDGNYYASLDEWKPKASEIMREESVPDDDLPF